MIRVYFLPVDVIDETEVVRGSGFMRNGILECTEQSDIRKLIQDTTDAEHFMLASLAETWREANPDEIAAYNALPAVPPPDPDYIRACEILECSPDVITAPEMWELLRIIGRRLGYRFD